MINHSYRREKEKVAPRTRACTRFANIRWKTSRAPVACKTRPDRSGIGIDYIGVLSLEYQEIVSVVKKNREYVARYVKLCSRDPRGAVFRGACERIDGRAMFVLFRERTRAGEKTLS